MVNINTDLFSLKWSLASSYFCWFTALLPTPVRWRSACWNMILRRRRKTSIISFQWYESLAILSLINLQRKLSISALVIVVIKMFHNLKLSHLYKWYWKWNHLIYQYIYIYDPFNKKIMNISSCQCKKWSTGKLRLRYVSRFDSHGWNGNFLASKKILVIHLRPFLNYFILWTFLCVHLKNGALGNLG